jgi:hypothetical protein
VAESAPEFVAVDGEWLLTVSRQATPSVRFLRDSGAALTLAAGFEPPEVEIASTEAVSVAIAGDLAAIGVWPHHSTAQLLATGNAQVPGHVLTYRRAGDAWTPDSTLTHPDGESNTQFGWSVALEGNTLVVGDPGKFDRGAAFVYERDADGWELSDELAGVGVHPSEEFGASVALSGDTVVVGAPGDVTIVPGDPTAETSWGAGAVHVFERNAGGEAFSQVGFLRPDAPARGRPYCWGMSCRSIPSGVERFGTDVAIAGDWIVVGAPGEETRGAAHVFFRDRARGMSDPWQLAELLLPPENQRGFGSDVAADAERIAVGCAEDVGAPGRVRGISTIGTVSLFALDAGRWARQGTVRTPVTVGASRAEFDLGSDRLAVAGYRPLGAGFADVYRVERVR